MDTKVMLFRNKSKSLSDYGNIHCDSGGFGRAKLCQSDGVDKKDVEEI